MAPWKYFSSTVDEFLVLKAVKEDISGKLSDMNNLLNPTSKILLRLAVEAPENSIFSWWEDGQVVTSWGARETHAQVEGMASALLQRWKFSAGDVVLLCYSPGLEFVRAFLGCIRAGIIAVPVAPLDPRSPAKVIHCFFVLLLGWEHQACLSQQGL